MGFVIFVMVSVKKTSRAAARKRRGDAKARKNRVKFRKILSRYATASEKRKFQEAAQKDRLEANEARSIAAKRRAKVAGRKLTKKTSDQ